MPQKVRHWLQEKPDLSLRELIELIHGKTGIVVIVQGVEVKIAAPGAKLIYLGLISDGYGSPVEPRWSRIRTQLRGMKARTRKALDHTLMTIL